MKAFSLILILFFVTINCDTWLPQVTGYSTSDANNGYAGILGKPITALRVSGGKKYKVHLLNGGWLPYVTGNDQSDFENGYAGNGKIIDGVCIVGTKYRVHVKGGSWLPAVSKCDPSDLTNGMAGNIGSAIDAVMVKSRTYAVAYSGSSSGGSSSGGSSSNMKVSDNGLNLIKSFEGCVLTAYTDSVGVITIGWGTTNACSDIIGTTIYSGMTISQATADEWLRKVVDANIAPAVAKYDSTYHWTQNQFDALVSFCYNLGSNILGELTNNGQNSKSEIASDMLLYVKAGGVTLDGLVRRRKAEVELFNS